MPLFCIGTVVQAEGGIDKTATYPGRAIVPSSSGGTDFMGLGLLKKNALDPCESSTNRDTEIFWGCHGELISEESSAGDIQINLAANKFVLSRDLSESTDREFDELMMIVDALPRLVTFACYPAYRISDVPLLVTEDLRAADITYSGSLRRLIQTDENLIRWELDAFDVYQTLSSYCPDYYCEFAVVRTSAKFWQCNSASLRESIYLERMALNVLLSEGSFTVTKNFSQTSDSMEVHLDRFVSDVAVLMESIACHPESSLMDVPVSAERLRNKLTEKEIDSLGELSAESQNQLTFTANAYKVYTSIGKSCLE